MTKKGLLLALLSVCFVATSTFAISSCDKTSEQTVKIEKVEYDEKGDLKITYTDGRTETVDAPNTETFQYQKIAGKEEYRVIGLGTVSDLDIVIPATYRGLTVTEIGQYAFRDSTYITSVVIPDSVTSIGYQAFRDCSSLTSVEIPDRVTSIGDGAFFDCVSLTSLEIGNGVTTIGDGAFYDCDSLTSVVIGDSVTTIGSSAFSDCDSLTSVVIGDSVTTIGGEAFAGCTSLTSVVIPNSVTTIGSYAFYDCDSLTIYCEPESKLSGWKSDWNGLWYYDSSYIPVVWGYKGE